MKSNKEPGY